MPRDVAFLRAMNVGGRIAKMDALRSYFGAEGLKEVATMRRPRLAFVHRVDDMGAPLVPHPRACWPWSLGSRDRASGYALGGCEPRSSCRRRRGSCGPRHSALRQQ
jgi:Protein of unknown function (DUF1697)